MNRTEVTLFALQSIDGKISFDGDDKYDFDRDIPGMTYTSRGWYQYFEEQQRLSPWCINSGKTLAKVGWNDRVVDKNDVVCRVVVDSYHLTSAGLQNLINGSKQVILVTEERAHRLCNPGVPTITFDRSLDPTLLLENLYSMFGVKEAVLEAGGTLNSLFCEYGLIDNIDIIIAPMLVGGKSTPTAIDGVGVECAQDLELLNEYELSKVCVLQYNYMNLCYRRILKK